MTWPLQWPAGLICVLRGHQPLLEGVRDAWGRTVTVRWICRRCRADLGVLLKAQ